MAETLQQYQQEYKDHVRKFHIYRGMNKCSFCNKMRGGFETYAREGLGKFICTVCVVSPEAAQAPAPEAAQAPAPEAVQGEIIDVPFTQGTKRLQVIVKVYEDWEDFVFLDDSNVQKINTYSDPTIRQTYFVPPNRTIRLFIKNLGVDSLVLKIVKVDVNLNAGPMTRVMLESNVETVLFDRHRPHNTDRESLKISDSSGKLLMILSFQEILEQHKPKRKREGGSALGGAQLTLLDNSLRSLCLLAQDT